MVGDGGGSSGVSAWYTEGSGDPYISSDVFWSLPVWLLWSLLCLVLAGVVFGVKTVKTCTRVQGGKELRASSCAAT